MWTHFIKTIMFLTYNSFSNKTINVDSNKTINVDYNFGLNDNNLNYSQLPIAHDSIINYVNSSTIDNINSSDLYKKQYKKKKKLKKKRKIRSYRDVNSYDSSVRNINKESQDLGVDDPSKSMEKYSDRFIVYDFGQDHISLNKTTDGSFVSKIYVKIEKYEKVSNSIIADLFFLADDLFVKPLPDCQESFFIIYKLDSDYYNIKILPNEFTDGGEKVGIKLYKFKIPNYFWYKYDFEDNYLFIQNIINVEDCKLVVPFISHYSLMLDENYSDYSYSRNVVYLDVKNQNSSYSVWPIKFPEKNSCTQVSQTHNPKNIEILHLDKNTYLVSREGKDDKFIETVSLYDICDAGKMLVHIGNPWLQAVDLGYKNVIWSRLLKFKISNYKEVDFDDNSYAAKGIVPMITSMIKHDNILILSCIVPTNANSFPEYIQRQTSGFYFLNNGESLRPEIINYKGRNIVYYYAKNQKVFSIHYIWIQNKESKYELKAILKFNQNEYFKEWEKLFIKKDDLLLPIEIKYDSEIISRSSVSEDNKTTTTTQDPNYLWFENFFDSDYNQIGSNDIPVNTTKVPEEPNSIQVNTTKVPEEPNSIQVNTTKVPEEPNGIQVNTTKVPEEPNSIQVNTTKVPEEPNSIQVNTTKVPEEPNGIQVNTTKVPEEPNSIQVNTTKVPEEPNGIQVNTTKVPEEPNSIQVNTTKVPEEPNGIQVNTTKVPEEPNGIQVNTTKVPEEPNGIQVNTTKVPEEPNGIQVNTTKVPEEPNSIQVNTTKVPEELNSIQVNTTKVPEEPNSIQVRPNEHSEKEKNSPKKSNNSLYPLFSLFAVFIVFIASIYFLCFKKKKPKPIPVYNNPNIFSLDSDNDSDEIETINNQETELTLRYCFLDESDEQNYSVATNFNPSGDICSNI